MAPKVELADAVIEQLVKDHLHRESETHVVAKHAKRHGLGYAKLAAAIGALVVAINGYTALQKTNTNLAKENRVLFNAVAKKVNSMSEELAYLRGRVEGMKHEEATEAVEEKIKPLEANGVDEPPVDIRRPRTKGKSKFRPMSRPVEGHATHVVIEGDQELVEIRQVLQAPVLKVRAYDQLPVDLSELLELEEQAQEQLQEAQ